MPARDIVKLGIILSISLFCSGCNLTKQNASLDERKPNVILINCDDLGYGEVGCFGAPFETPNIDSLAVHGVRLTSFYAGNAYCSPSRASLMTGCYAPRVGIPGVLFNVDDYGINPEEKTLAEVFKGAGYTTACVGKWHLGHLEKFLPPQHGFDEFYGIPYSHDMWPKHSRQYKWNFPELPLIKGTEKIDEIHDPAILTRILTEYSVDFIERSKDNPFFLYLPHPMPHGPHAVTEKFKDISGYGLFADVIVEIDWSVGEIMKKLTELALVENTIVIFTSDNGGPRDNKGDGPFRGGKGTAFEGGQRVPMIISWPGVIPENKLNHEAGTHMDFVPTFCNFLEVPLPEKEIDGKDIWDLFICKPQARSPYDEIFFFMGKELQSMRAGKWKYHTPHEFLYTGKMEGAKPGQRYFPLEEALYNLETDIREQHNIINEYPEVADSLRTIFRKWLVNFEKEKREPGKMDTTTVE